jgi:hypothetical protein
MRAYSRTGTFNAASSIARMSESGVGMEVIKPPALPR